jgi:hypothetical protein
MARFKYEEWFLTIQTVKNHSSYLPGRDPRFAQDDKLDLSVHGYPFGKFGLEFVHLTKLICCFQVFICSKEALIRETAFKLWIRNEIDSFSLRSKNSAT